MERVFDAVLIGFSPKWMVHEVRDRVVPVVHRPVGAMWTKQSETTRSTRFVDAVICAIARRVLVPVRTERLVATVGRFGRHDSGVGLFGVTRRSVFHKGAAGVRCLIEHG